MLKVIRRDAIILRVGTTYRKKTSAVWELEDQPKSGESVIFCYEDIRPSLYLH